MSPDRSKVVVIMPAYNAAETLERTYNDLPLGVVDKVILVDDVSQDETVEIARRLGLKTVIHVQNRGYGGNQKTCYLEALKDGADIVVMLHPDYQYDSQRVPELIAPILRDEADVVLGSRFLSGGPLAGGMPIWKYVANRFLTTVENLVLGLKLSEAHTGLRAYRREVLETVPFLLNSDDFVFDTQIIAQTVAFGFRVDEIGVPTRYFEEASSVNFGQSVVYGFATLWTMLRFLLDKWGLWRCDLFRKPLRQIISRHHARDLLRTAVSEDQPPEPEPPRRIQRYDLLAVLILLLLWGLFSWRFFTPNEADRVSLPAGDFTQQFYVFRAFAYGEFRQGQFPLWMPCIYAGYPYQADPQSASLYPPLWVTMLALRAMGYGHYPLSALVVEVLAHLLAASLFTYAFLRAEGGRRPAALLGAVAFAYGGFLTGYPLLQSAIAETATWLPLALLGARWFVGERRIAGVVLSAIALALSVLAGHPQTMLFVFSLTLAYWIFLTWPSSRWRALLIAASIAVLAVALSAGQILPTLAYSQLSTRSGLSFAQAGTGLPLRDVLQFFVTGLVSHWQPLYVGVLSLVLATLAVIAGRRATKLFWLAVAVVGLFLSFGGNAALFDLVYLLWPGYRLFRGQERHALVVSFALVVLASQGLDVLLLPLRRRERRWLAVIVRYLGLALPVLLLTLGVLVVSLQGSDPSTERVTLSERLAFLLLMAFLAWLLLGGRLHQGRVRQTIGWLAVGILVLDLFTLNRPLSYAPVEPLFPVTPSIAPMLADETPFFRFQDDYRLPGHTGCAHGLEEVYGITPIKLARYQAFIERVPEEVRWSLLGVRYLVTWRGGLERPDGTPIPAEQLHHEGESPDMIYVHRLAKEPRLAWVVHEVWTARDDDELYTLLATPGFDARRIAVVKGVPPAVVPATGEGETVTVVERRPTRLRLWVTLSSPGLLVLSQSNYPGWEAVVNGKPVKLLEADGLLPAVALPNGTSDVVFRYRPAPFQVGLILSGITAVAGVLLLLLRARAFRSPGSRG